MKVILISLLVVLQTIATLAVISMAMLDNNRKVQSKAGKIFMSLFIIAFFGGLITLIMYFYASLIFGYSM
mgnify:CR=1 FL=1|jgi:hypothetical protein